jgi:hypothetical protein
VVSGQVVRGQLSAVRTRRRKRLGRGKSFFRTFVRSRGSGSYNDRMTPLPELLRWLVVASLAVSLGRGGIAAPCSGPCGGTAAAVSRQGCCCGGERSSCGSPCCAASSDKQERASTSANPVERREQAKSHQVATAFTAELRRAVFPRPSSAPTMERVPLLTLVSLHICLLV